KQVIDEFENLYPDFKSGKAKHRNESLDVSLSFSLNRLSEETKKQMSGLGVFEGRAMGFAIGHICEIEEWDEVGEKFMGELEGVGLVKKENLPVPVGLFDSMYSKEDIPQEMFEETMLMPFYKFHSTLAPYLRARQTSKERNALEERYLKFYCAFSSKLYYGDDNAPHETRIIAQKEMPNLRHALDIAMKAGKTDMAVNFAEIVGQFLYYFGRWWERDTMMKKMEFVMRTSLSDGPLTKAEYLMQSRQGEVLWRNGQAEEAEQVYRGLLARMDAGTEYDGAYDRVVTLNGLGRCLRSQGRAVEAETEHRRALDVLEGMNQEDKLVRRETGVVHTDLAATLRDQGYYSAAKKYYEESLRIKEKFIGGERNKTIVLGELGQLALILGDYGEARHRYQEALTYMKHLGETQNEAKILHMLATVDLEEAKKTTGPQQSSLLTKADKAYMESLRLNESLGNKTEVAKNADQLAKVSETAKRFTDAERWYHRAIELKKESVNPKELFISYNNLAALFLGIHKIPQNERPPAFAKRDLLSEAEKWAHQARKIAEPIGDPSIEIWATYNILVYIAKARNNLEDFSHWRKKHRKAHAAFPGHWEKLMPKELFQKARNGDRDAVQKINGLFNGGNFPVALEKVLSGERDAEKLGDELNLDCRSYLFLIKVLEGLSGPRITTD
ncbi:MAG: tetratricopeptide repeat protein, partial [bacterium]|nr:tetratricopeptide repeat protein [bacterium]